MSTKPSARNSSSATYCGAMQTLAIFPRRIVVVSSGASWADELAGPRRPATPAEDSVARKRRRSCISGMTGLLQSALRQCLHNGRGDRQPPICSSLELALELIEGAKVGCLPDELVRARLDHARLVQPQAVEADGV